MIDSMVNQFFWVLFVFLLQDQALCCCLCPFAALSTLHGYRCTCFIHSLGLSFCQYHSLLLCFFSSCPQVSVQYQVHLLFIDLCSAPRLHSRSLLPAEKTSFITEILGALGWNERAGKQRQEHSSAAL